MNMQAMYNKRSNPRKLRLDTIGFSNSISSMVNNNKLGSNHRPSSNHRPLTLAIGYGMISTRNGDVKYRELGNGHD